MFGAHLQQRAGRLVQHIVRPVQAQRDSGALCFSLCGRFGQHVQQAACELVLGRRLGECGVQIRLVLANNVHEL